MIGRTNAGGGGGAKITITIYGVKNEVITYTGAASGSVTLDDNGVGYISTRKGVYQFSAGTSGFTISKSCNADTTVRMIPATLLAPNASIVPFVGQLVKEGDNLGLPYWNAETSEFKTNGNEAGIVYSSLPINFAEVETVTVNVNTIASWKGGKAPSFFISSAKPTVAAGALVTAVESWFLPENVSSTGTKTDVERTIDVSAYDGTYYIGIIVAGSSTLTGTSGKATGITITCA